MASKKRSVTPSSKIEKKEIVKKTVKKTDGIMLDVFDTKGNVSESISVSKEVFGAKVNETLITQAVRVYLANQRRGTVKTKTRGEVQGSTRKIYRQKGTGRARHGSVRAPIFVHGGIVFGPQPRDYSLKFPQKMKQKALFSALTTRVQNDGIKVISGLEKLSPKTKEMVDVLRKLKIYSKKDTVLLVIPSPTEKKEVVENITRASRNIAGISIIPVNQLNTYEVLRYTVLLFMKDTLGVFSQGTK
ncbi:MAG: 50S ribosomal protein L4 [Candidatus Levybacteria bacterium]|nr:50S ribosomal protein L4 [Candidatus Levybacteria bacterium]